MNREIEIPKGYEARINGNKVILEPKDSEDERIRKELWEYFHELELKSDRDFSPSFTIDDILAWLEKQKDLDKMIVVSPEVWDKAIADAYENGKKDNEKQKEQKPKRERKKPKESWLERSKYELAHEEELLIKRQKELSEIRALKDNEQKPADDKAFEEWIDSWWKHNKVNNPDSYDKGDEIQFDERGFKNFCRGIRNMYAWQKPAEWNEDYQEKDIQTRFAFYTYKNEEDDGVLYLSNVFVEEASRNHGFGTRILRAAEKVAEIIGATTICLKVKQDSPANAWYRKNGYGYVAFEDGYDWLEKNLEYMKPNKQEWSEEDEKDIQEASDYLRHYANNYVQGGNSKLYIQSLADRIESLRPSWKPSEEQMKSLKQARDYYMSGRIKYVGQHLNEIAEQLEKLM